MKAVLTADIIKSSTKPSSQWNSSLRACLNRFATEGTGWEIYRGDEIQILLQDVADTLTAAITIRASLIKEGLDARISIGLGEVDFNGTNVKESNGTAFLHSGRNLEKMKSGIAQNISISTDNEAFDEQFNLIFLLMEPSIERWTEKSANAVLHFLENPDSNQQQIAQKMGLTQGSLSKSLKRANLDSLLKVDSYFRNRVAPKLS